MEKGIVRPIQKSRIKKVHTKTLLELHAQFLEFTKQPGVLRCHREFSRAKGLYFVCPQCKGSHGVILLFAHPNVPDEASPPGRWNASGTSLNTLSLVEKAKSYDCGWTGVVKDGRVSWT